MAFLRWLWAGNGAGGVTGGWAFWAHAGLRQEPRKGEGAGGGGQDACAQTRGPLRLQRKPRVASCSVLPPSQQPAGRPARPTCPSDPCFLWGLRGACSCQDQAADTGAALLPASAGRVCGHVSVGLLEGPQSREGKVGVSVRDRLELRTWPHCLLIM